MKRKIVAVFLAISLLTAGVVSAASIWGTYKGNSIIRLTVDGTPVKVSDVPAISYNGRTMLPIYLLQQAGIKYTWDSNNQTVDITTTTTTNSSSVSVDYIKDLSTAASYYNQLTNLGDQLAGVSTSLGLTFDSINYGEQDEMVQTTYDQLTEAINNYNELIDYAKTLSTRLLQSNISISDGDQSLNYFYSAIDYYKESYSKLIDYISSKATSDFNKYLDNRRDGFNAAHEGRLLSGKNFYKYMDLVQKA